MEISCISNFSNGILYFKFNFTKHLCLMKNCAQLKVEVKRRYLLAKFWNFVILFCSGKYEFMMFHWILFSHLLFQATYNILISHRIEVSSFKRWKCNHDHLISKKHSFTMNVTSHVIMSQLLQTWYFVTWLQTGKHSDL